MSDLFMDVHSRRPRCNSQLATSPSTIDATTPTSESASSTQHYDDHLFSHHNYSTAYATDASSNANYNRLYCKEGDKEKSYNSANDSEEFANTLSLKLRKPKHWKWELTTSKSCSNISLPRILLYDNNGKLLVDAQGNKERVYREEDNVKLKRDRSRIRCHQQRNNTLNLTHSIRKALEKGFNGLQIKEATPSPESYSSMSNHSQHSRKPIDFATKDLPNYGLSRRSSSLRGVRFNVEDDVKDSTYYQSQIPEFLPTPPSTTTPTSSSSGPREKRKYRRSHSSGRSSALSESILERFSYQKGRFSSPEYAIEKEVQHDPCYFLRTSRAGTLLVQEDSFRQHPRRRRRLSKNRSSESLQSTQKSSSTSKQLFQQQHSGTTSPASNDMSHNRKQQFIRRHKTDGSILLNRQSSISEEDVAVIAGVQKQLMDDVNSGHAHKYTPECNQVKELDYSNKIIQNGKVR